MKSLSDNAALNQLVDEAIEGLSAAASPYEYYESWAKLDAFVDQIGELSRQVLKPKNYSLLNPTNCSYSSCLVLEWSQSLRLAFLIIIFLR